MNNNDGGERSQPSYEHFYLYKDTDRQTDRQTDRRTDGQFIVCYPKTSLTLPQTDYILLGKDTFPCCKVYLPKLLNGVRNSVWEIKLLQSSVCSRCVLSPGDSVRVLSGCSLQGANKENPLGKIILGNSFNNIYSVYREWLPLTRATYIRKS